MATPGGSGRSSNKRGGGLLRKASDDPLSMFESLVAKSEEILSSPGGGAGGKAASKRKVSKGAASKAPPAPSVTATKEEEDNVTVSKADASTSSRNERGAAAEAAAGDHRATNNVTASTTAKSNNSPPRSGGYISAQRSAAFAALEAANGVPPVESVPLAFRAVSTHQQEQQVPRASGASSGGGGDRTRSVGMDLSECGNVDDQQQQQQQQQQPPRRRLSSLNIGMRRRMSHDSLNSGGTGNTGHTGHTGGGATTSNHSLLAPTTCTHNRRSSGLDLPMLAPPTTNRRGSSMAPSGTGFAAGAFHPSQLNTANHTKTEFHDSSSSSSSSSWAGDEGLLGGMNPHNNVPSASELVRSSNESALASAKQEFSKFDHNLVAATSKATGGATEQGVPAGRGLAVGNSAALDSNACKPGDLETPAPVLARHSSVPVAAQDDSALDPAEPSTIPPAVVVNRRSSLPDNMDKISFRRSSTYIRPECLDDLADNVRDTLSELGVRISAGGRRDTDSRQTGIFKRAGGSSGSLGSFAFSFGAGQSPEDVDAPGLVAEAFQRLVAGLLSSSDALELSGARGPEGSMVDKGNSDDDEEGRDRRKEARKKWQTTAINSQALHGLMAQIPQVNLTFSAVKPVLVAISREEYDEVDDSMLDGLERLARLVDLLTEIVGKVNSRQEWDDKSETTFLTLLCLTRMECDRLEDEYEEDFMGDGYGCGGSGDSMDGTGSSHSMGSLAMGFLGGGAPPLDREGGLVGGQAEWQDLLQRTWCKSGREAEWRKIFHSDDEEEGSEGNDKSMVKEEEKEVNTNSIEPASFQQAAIDVIKLTGPWKPDCMEDLFFACHLACPIPKFCGENVEHSNSGLAGVDAFRAETPEEANTILARVKDTKVPRDRELENVVRSLVPPDALALRRGSQRNSKNLEQSLRGENDPTVVVVTSSPPLEVAARKRWSLLQDKAARSASISSNEDQPGVGGTRSTVADSLLGKAGTGKTMLAAMVAAREEVRWWFKGGIAWVNVGRRGDTDFVDHRNTGAGSVAADSDPSISSPALGGMSYSYYRVCLIDICRQLGVDDENMPEFEDHLLVPFESNDDRRSEERHFMTIAKERMIRFLSESQNTLIILDDVWHPEDVNWFNFYPEQVFAGLPSRPAGVNGSFRGSIADHRGSSTYEPAEEGDEKSNVNGTMSRTNSSGSIDIAIATATGVAGEGSSRPRKRRGGGKSAKRRMSGGIFSAGIEGVIEGVIEGAVEDPPDDTLNAGDASGDEDAGERRRRRRGSGGKFGAKRRMSGGMFTASIDLEKLEGALEGSRSSSMSLEGGDVKSQHSSFGRRQGRFGLARRRSSGNLFAGIISAAKKQSHLLVTTRVPNLQNGNCWQMSLDGLHENEALSLLMTESGQPANHVMRTSIEACTITAACDQNHALTLRTAGRWLRMLGTGNKFIKSIEDVSSTIKQALEESAQGETGNDIGNKRLEFFDVLGVAIPMVLTSQWKRENPKLVWRCFASFVVVFCNNDFGSYGGSPIPLDAANILWKKLLRYNERGEDERKIAGYTDDLKEELVLVTNVLGPLGMVNIINDERTDGERERLLEVSHELFEEYGHFLATDPRGGLERMDRWYRQAWHEAFVAGYLESRRGLSWDEGVMDDTASSLLKYGLQRIVQHILHAGMVDKARNLLVDKSFIRGRLSLLGADEGTQIHADDCKTFGERAKLSEYAQDEFYVRDTIVLAFEVVSDCIISELLAENDTDETLCMDCSRALYSLGLSLAEFGCEGAWQEAIDYFRKAIESVRGTAGNVEFCAAAFVDISAVYLDKGDLAEARRALEEAIDIRIACLPEDDVRVAITLRKLADVLVLMDAKQEAATLYQEASDVAKADLEKNRLLVADILHAKGTLHHQEEQPGPALEALRESLQWKRMELGNDEPSLALQYYAIGNILIAEGDQDGAIYNFEESIRLRKLRPSDDPMVQADLLSAEGMLQNLKGETRQALGCLQKVIGICRDLGLENDIRVAQIKFEVGELHFTQGEYEEAAVCFENVLAVRRSKLGDSLEVHLTEYKLGCAQGFINSQRAIKTLMAALAGFQSAQENDSEEAALTMHELGMIHKNSGDLDNALNWLTKEIEMRRKLYGNDHESIIAASFGLGLVHEATGDYNNALKCYKDLKRINDGKQDSNQLTSADILFRTGIVNAELSRFDEALSALDSSLRIRESNLGYNNTLVAQTTNRIANVQLAQGKYDKALQSFNEVLGLEYEFTDEDRVEVADTLFGKGRVLHSKEEPEDAMKAYEEALYWKKLVLGEDDPGLSPIYEEMGHVHVDKGRKDDAIHCFETALQLRERQTDSKRSKEEALSLTTSGFLHRARGNERKGLEDFKKSCRLYEARIGSENVKYADMQYQMGLSYLALNRFEKGKRLLENCLETRKKLLGKHMDVAMTLESLASAHIHINGDYGGALNYLEDAIDIRRNVLKENDNIAAALETCGNTCKKMGEHDKALSYYDETLQLKRLLHGEHHTSLASTLQEMGNLMNEIGEYEQGIKCIDNALELRRQEQGADHPDVAALLYCKGFALHHIGDNDAALTALNESLEIRKGHYGDEHFSVGDTLNIMGFVYSRKSDNKNALQCLWDALAARKACNDHTKVASTLQNIGNVHSVRREFDEAIASYEECRRIREKELGKDHVKVGETWSMLGHMHADADHTEDATRCLEEALRVRELNFGKEDDKSAVILQKMGALHIKAGEQEKGRERFESFMRICRAKKNYQTEDYATALTIVGNTYAVEGDQDNAEVKWKEALKIYKRLGLGEDHPAVARVTRNLSDGYGALSGLRRSAAWLQRAAAGLSEEVT